MHISLDSALGQQRRLNQVGETISSIAAPTAAYSLRSITGGDPKVVRVRRESDNHEQDFTASEVSSGALVDFVNTQVTAPLDIQALTATGRDGDFLIAKAAYSLRSLGTRQATVAATGDTVARANGKYVCQVRRSSDDALKSFTADEITDGTLLAFTNADYVKYTSDFSAGDDGWGSLDDVTETGNIDGIGGLDNNLRLAIGSSTSQHRAFKTGILPVNQKINFSARVFIPSTNSVVDSLGIRDASGSVIIAAGTTPAQDQWVTVTASNVTTTNTSGQLRVDLQDGGTNNFAGNGSDVIYLREITVTQVTSDGFVKTWYDQSVTNQAGDTATGNNATQATAANQPKIVDAGVLQSGLRFDGTNDFLDLGSAVDFNSTNANFIVWKQDQEDSAVILLSEDKDGTGTTQIDIRSSQVNYRIGGSSANNLISATTDMDVLNVVSFLRTTSSSYSAFRNGSSLGTDSSTNTNNSTFQYIGAESTAQIDGLVSEIIIYASDQTDNRTAIEANIGEHYSISGIPAFDNSVNGFVETWYDQSGNGRDAVQATASKQPLIVESGSLNVDSFSNPTIRFEKDSETHFTTTDETLDPNLEVSAFVVQKDEQVANQNSAWVAMRESSSQGRKSAFEMGVNNNSIKFRLAYDPGADATNKDDIEVTVASDGLGTTSIMSSIKTSSGDLDGFFNGSSVIDTTVTDNTDLGSSYGITMGKHTNTGQFADGRLNEVIFYLSDQTANRSAIETNLANHYGITLL